MIDLQMHSTFSDGSMTPTELVQKAKSMGLTAKNIKLKQYQVSRLV